MGTLTIRDLDDSIKLRLRVRAAAQNRSMEEEARQILRSALLVEPDTAGAAFAARVRGRFASLGDVVLKIEPREPVRTPLVLHEPEAVHAAVPVRPAKRVASAPAAESASASARRKRSP